MEHWHRGHDEHLSAHEAEAPAKAVWGTPALTILPIDDSAADFTVNDDGGLPS